MNVEGFLFNEEIVFPISRRDAFGRGQGQKRTPARKPGTLIKNH